MKKAIFLNHEKFAATSSRPLPNPHTTATTWASSTNTIWSTKGRRRMNRVSRFYSNLEINKTVYEQSTDLFWFLRNVEKMVSSYFLFFLSLSNAIFHFLPFHIAKWRMLAMFTRCLRRYGNERSGCISSGFFLLSFFGYYFFLYIFPKSYFSHYFHASQVFPNLEN